MSNAPETWLSGPVEGVIPYLIPVAHALVQAGRDLENAADLTPEELHHAGTLAWLREGLSGLRSSRVPRPCEDPLTGLRWREEKRLKLYYLTDTLEGLVDDLPRATNPEEAEILVLGSKPVELAQFSRLRALFRVGAGRDNIPWEAAERRGLTVGLPSAVSFEILYDEVAGFACHLLLRLAFADAEALETGRRARRPALRKRRLLVVGAGNIGRRVAARLGPWLRVTAIDARRPRAELAACLAQSDLVSLHLPLAENTRGLLGAAELACLPDGAALVNTARAALVDESALLAEIRTGRLRAAFDVFWHEPYRGPLAAYHPGRFLMTPHVAGSCHEFLEAAAADLRAFVRNVSA